MTISSALMTQVSRYLSSNLGWHFPVERWPDLERGLKEIARKRDFETAEACINWLLSTAAPTREGIDALAVEFTVGETYFNREIESLEALETQILPELIRSRRGGSRRLRVWSAGCCTGEEPYSLAILLHRLIPDLDTWDVTILGTDINPYFLEKAREGIYRQWSFRNSPLWIKDRYFRGRQDGSLEILPQIKRMVRLEQLNLVEESSAQLDGQVSGMDLILCRNVLIYFSSDVGAKVLNRFHHALAGGGWLVVGQTEISRVPTQHFETVNFSGAALFRKRERSDRARERFVGEESRQTKYRAGDLDASPLARRKHSGQLAKDTEAPRRKEPLTREQELALYKQGRYKELGEDLLCLATAVDSLPNPRVMTLLAKVFANQGKYDEALQWVEKAISADKLDAPSRYLHATILQEQSRIDDAIRALKGAIYLEPDFVIAHFSLGNLMLKKGLTTEGKRSLIIALGLLAASPKDAPIPESEGMSSARLTEIITSIIAKDVE